MMNGTSSHIAWVALLAVASALVTVGCENAPPRSVTSAAVSQATYATPSAAADALVQAAGSWNVPALMEILGPDGKDIVASRDQVQDRSRAATFAAKARERKHVVLDPTHAGHATLVVGDEDWPVPIPIVQDHGRWRFDTAAGRQEILRRRVGANELDAITVCRGYVEAQEEYASRIHDQAMVNQYAQRIISDPGKHDGLAWQSPDGTWGGPVGETVAKAIAQGFSRGEPFHGYYFKVLKGQGPAARLGKLNYVMDGAMIGGFALAAWPAEYGVTGVQTFIVSYDGVVYQKDLGPQTSKTAASMELYDPDASWTPTEDAWQ